MKKTIVFLKLRAENFTSFDSIEVDLVTNSVTQIIGKNLDEDIDSSNGAGKTSIYLAITEALYSKNIKGIQKVNLQNKYKKDNFKVIVDMLINNEPYSVTYTKNETILYHNNKKFLIGRQNVTKFFSAIMSFDLFISLTYIHPKHHINFFGKDKKDVIAVLFEEMQKFQDIHTKITSAISKKHVELKTLKNVNIINDVKVEPLRQEIIVKKPQLTDISNLKVKLNEQKAIKEKKEQLIKEYTSIIYPEYKTKPSDEILIKIRGNISAQKSKLKQLQTLDGKSVCDKCFRPIDTDKFSLALKKEKQKLQSLEDEYELEKGLFDKAVEGHKKYLLKQAIDNMPDEDIELEKTIKKYEKINEQLQEEYYNQLEEAREIREHNLKQTERIKMIEMNKKQQEKIDKETVELENELDMLQVLAKVFDKNGLVKDELEKRLYYLDTLINKELREFTDEFELHFTFKNNKIKDTIVSKNKEYDFANLSSGEQVRLILSLVFIVKKLLRNIKDIDINIIFIDEIANLLDVSGRQKLIQKAIKESYNIFLLSPIELSIDDSTTLLVTKKNKLSTVKYVESI